MADKITSFSKDVNDGSYTFGFLFEIGFLNGDNETYSQNINVTKDQAKDIESAKTVALQLAADAKQAWLDSLDDVKVLGEVILPLSTKAARALEAQPAKLEAQPVKIE